MSKQIIATDGQVVLVSDEDYDFIHLCYDLYVDNHGYVNTRIKVKNMGLMKGTLHRVIMQPPKGKSIHVDHIDGDKLNNCRENLRICTHEENMRNRKKHKEAESKYKGVNWHKGSEAWQVRMNKYEKRVYIGLFSNEIAAANCYNYFARIMYKDFAELNNVPFMTKDEWESYQLGKQKHSKYRGVTKGNKGGWISQIWDNINKKNLVLGEFETEIEAAKVWNKKAIELRGNDTYLNEII